MAKIFLSELDSILSRYKTELFKYDQPVEIICGMYADNLDNMPGLIQMLFDPNYDVEDIWYYKFKKIPLKDAVLPESFKSKLGTDPSAELWISSDDSDSTNIFNFNPEDILLIEQLYKFKLHKPDFDLSTITYTFLSDTGKSIYNWLTFLSTNLFYSPPKDMFEGNILAFSLKIVSLHQHINYLKDMSVTFLRSDERF